MTAEYQRYIPAVDGLRALAILLILVYHLGWDFLPGGFLGVDIFFILSGYWITRILKQEIQKTGKIQLKRFLLKRIRRLYPAMILTICLITILILMRDPAKLGANRIHVLATLFFFNNWQQIIQGESYLTLIDPSSFRHFWSLAVEGQFYLLWGIVFSKFFYPNTPLVNQKKYWYLALGSLVFSTLIYGIHFLFLPTATEVLNDCQADLQTKFLSFSSFCISPLDFTYLGTFSKLLPISCGATLALLYPVQQQNSATHEKTGKSSVISKTEITKNYHTIIARCQLILFDVLGILALTSIIYLSLTMKLDFLDVDGQKRIFRPLFEWGLPFLSLVTTVLLFTLLQSKTYTSRLFSLPSMMWLGTRSYGIYLYHWPIFLAIKDSGRLTLSWSEGMLAIALTFLCAELSYIYLEQPIRRSGLVNFLWNRSDINQEPSTDSQKNLFPKLEKKHWRFKRRLYSSGKIIFIILIVSFVISQYWLTKSHDTKLAQQIELNEQITVDLLKEDQVFPLIAKDDNKNVKQTPPPPIESETLDQLPTNQKTIDKELQRKITATAKSQPDFTRLKNLRIIGIGDSVMLGGATALKEHGILVDAKIKRKPIQVLAIVTQLQQEEAQIDALILHIGTNASIRKQVLHKLLAQLADIPIVLLLTLVGDRQWIPPNNEILRNAPTHWQNVSLLDWQEVSKECDTCFLRDGIHLSKNGQKLYAEKISGSLMNYSYSQDHSLNPKE